MNDDAAPPVPVATQSSEFIYVGMRDDDLPFVDYEGGGVVIEATTHRPDEDAPFTVELAAIELDPTRETFAIGDDVEDRLLVRLQAEITRHGENGFRMNGSLDARLPVRIQFVQMNAKGDSSGEDFPELAFAKGRHGVAFEATVVGWLEK